jgi:glycosyltransferase involved in cell wall biosynthesis
MISVITVCFNSKFQLIKTIDSLRNQTSQDFEYIIVDGNSNDGTLEVIKDNSDIISSFISEKDKGIYDAMNKGISFVNGDYILFLNSDDTLDDNFIEEIYKIISQYKPDFIYSSVSANFGTKTKTYTPPIIDNSFKFDRMPFPHPGFIAKRELYSSIGQFSTKYKYASDLDWMLRLLLDKSLIGIRNLKANAFYTIGGVGNSMKSLLESIKIFKKYNISKVKLARMFLVGLIKLVYLKYFCETKL